MISPHKWPVTRNMFPFDDVIMVICIETCAESQDQHDFSTVRTADYLFFLENTASVDNVTWFRVYGSNIYHTYLPAASVNLSVHITLQWRHNGRYSISNHQPRDCLHNRLFRHRSKKTSKLRVAGLCAGNSPETGEFPAQMASNAKNISIWWRHREEATQADRQYRDACSG